MVVFDRSQRRLLAETFRDIANVAAGAMVFGQFVAGTTFSPRLAAAGVAVWILLVVFAILAARGSK